MPVIGEIVFGLVQKAEEGWIGIQSVCCIALVVRLIDAHAVLMDGQRSDGQVDQKPNEQQGLLDAKRFKVSHANVSTRTEMGETCCVDGS